MNPDGSSVGGVRRGRSSQTLSGEKAQKRTRQGRKARLARAFASLALSVALLAGTAPSALATATVEDTDVLGAFTVSSLSSVEDLDAPEVDASSAILATSDGKVLYSRNVDEQVPMASTTKIMTALVALDQGSLDDVITVSENAADQEGSTAWLTAGDTFTLEQLLYAMMLPSGNDAAMAVAEYYGGGSTSQFLVLMNAKALELGMTSSHYASVNGVEDEDNYSTASDLLKLAIAALENETLREIVATTSYTCTSGDGYTLTWENTNELIEGYDGALGIKTGYTSAAGYCLVSAAEKDGIELYCVTLGGSTSDLRFQDAQTLFDWGFEHYHYVKVASVNVAIGEVVATAWLDKTVCVMPEEDVELLLFDYEEDLVQEVTLYNKAGTIQQGVELGSVVWYRDGEEVASVALVARETIDAPNLYEYVQICWYRFTALFTGDQISAEQEVFVDDTFDILEDAL